jgi:P27 family predicted phage terminase small subunit
MGKRGPQPTPQSVLALRGSPVAKERTDAAAVSGAPLMPVWLEGEAALEWERQIHDLDERGMLFQTDRAALAMYCQSWGEFVNAVEYVKESGEVTMTDKGNCIQHPMVGIKNQAFDRCNKLGQQFGFSPSSRVGMGEGKKKEKDGKSRFFKQSG